MSLCGCVCGWVDESVRVCVDVCVCARSCVCAGATEVVANDHAHELPPKVGEQELRKLAEATKGVHRIITQGRLGRERVTLLVLRQHCVLAALGAADAEGGADALACVCVCVRMWAGIHTHSHTYLPTGAYNQRKCMLVGWPCQTLRYSRADCTHARTCQHACTHARSHPCTHGTHALRHPCTHVCTHAHVRALAGAR